MSARKPKVEKVEVPATTTTAVREQKSTRGKKKKKKKRKKRKKRNKRKSLLGAKVHKFYPGAGLHKGEVIKSGLSGAYLDVLWSDGSVSQLPRADVHRHMVA